MCMRASLFVAVTECNSYLVVLVLSETERSKTVTAICIGTKIQNITNNNTYSERGVLQRLTTKFKRKKKNRIQQRLNNRHLR